MRLPSSLLLGLLLGLLLAGCTVGPNYSGPPQVPGAAPGKAAFVRGAGAASAEAPQVARWWTTLGDPLLDRLEAQALAANPNIAAAEARLRQARANLRLERANQLPSANASATYLHARLPGVNLGGSGSGSGSGGSSSGDGSGSGSGSGGGGGTTSLDFFNLGFDASWEVDLFGGQRRTVEAARANAAAAEESVADAQVSLSAEIANAYVGLRDRQHRLALSRRSAEMQGRMLALMQQRLRQGTASALDVERLQTQVESTNAQIVPLEAEIEAHLDALAVLTGAAPGTLDADLQPAAPVPLPPASVAVGDPAGLLQRRPDIRRAERQLAAATARIGVAEAARFPHLNLLGIIGIGGTSLSDLGNLGDFTAIGAPMLQWNLLDFGRGAARIRQSEAARDEAEAQYRGAVLSALQDAEDSLSRFRHRRETVATLARASASAARAASLMQQRYAAGTATLIDTLDAERQRVAAEQNLSQAVAALTGDYIAIQKALGLGWDAPAGGD